MAQPNKKQKLSHPAASNSNLDFLDSHPFVRREVLNRVHGCIFGSALGDTIGLYTEFMDKTTAREIYPNGQFELLGDAATPLHQDRHRKRFKPRAWTDDTDQALLIILGYLRHYTSHGEAPDINELSRSFSRRLKFWIERGLYALDRLPLGIGAFTGLIVRSKGYIGNEHLRATEAWVDSEKYSAPNGSLMRTHPIGVIGVGMSEAETLELSIAVGSTTHVDPRCTIACCIQVALVRGLIRGEIVNEEDLTACMVRVWYWIVANARHRIDPSLGYHQFTDGQPRSIKNKEMERLLDRDELFRHVVEPQTLGELQLAQAGALGYVYKTLGSAILCLRTAMRTIQEYQRDGHPVIFNHMLFRQLITDLIMEGGDADTNGAAAGALLGAYMGSSNIPYEWLVGLDNHDWLANKTARFAIAIGIDQGELQAEDDEATDGGEKQKQKKQAQGKEGLATKFAAQQHVTLSNVGDKTKTSGHHGIGGAGGSGATNKADPSPKTTGTTSKTPAKKSPSKAPTAPAPLVQGDKTFPPKVTVTAPEETTNASSSTGTTNSAAPVKSPPKSSVKKGKEPIRTPETPVKPKDPTKPLNPSPLFQIVAANSDPTPRPKKFAKKSGTSSGWIPPTVAGPSKTKAPVAGPAQTTDTDADPFETPATTTVAGPSKSKSTGSALSMISFKAPPKTPTKTPATPGPQAPTIPAQAMPTPPVTPKPASQKKSPQKKKG